MATPEKPKSRFVRSLTDVNLSTYFLLPLLELNKFSFGESNFIDTYVNSDGTVLTVEVVDRRLCPSFQTHPEYLKEEQGTQGDYIWFQIPEKWHKDFLRFKSGSYSKLSNDAKKMIITYSGLSYKVPGDDNKPITDARLLALEKSQVLREKWFHELGYHTTELPEDLELLPIPPERAFREYE